TNLLQAANLPNKRIPTAILRNVAGVIANVRITIRHIRAPPMSPNRVVKSGKTRKRPRKTIAYTEMNARSLAPNVSELESVMAPVSSRSELAMASTDDGVAKTIRRDYQTCHRSGMRNETPGSAAKHRYITAAGPTTVWPSLPGSQN